MASIVLLIIAGMAKGIMDRIAHHGLPAWMPALEYWDPKKSWVRKWKHGDPSKGEAFPLSSTVLVWLTDGWHLMQMIFLNCMTAAMVSSVKEFIVYGALLRIGFYLTYK